MKNILFFLVLLLFNLSFAQKKTLLTKFVSEKITIDGKFDEEIWKNAEISKDFVSFDPDNGNPEPKDRKTEVKIVYDNDAIYIAATMFDDPKKILKEFSKRDGFGTADFFGVFINGFNDGQQDFRFFVTASNGQMDCQASENDGEDYSWDAIWESQTRITETGWVAEMKLPYAALRFSPSQKQTWSLNFMREIRRDRQKYTWNFIDKKNGTFIQQAGILQGIENIKTPTRLFFLPYTSYYINADAENKTKGTLKGGMDIKYGINDAFTLDAVLIPDFGQTALDQKILNLGPFEQQFNENRSFFTEGTDLFNKGNLFYSRRIGGRPTGKANFDSNTEIKTQTPSIVGLLNATKISGRTKNGLGIGFLNAVTEDTFAIIQNKNDGTTRKELIEPLANYNIFVLDQRFRKNSSVSLINTNVTRNGNFRDANVTGLIWDLKTKANTYGINGNAEYSYVNNQEIKEGFRGFIEFNKTSGKYRFGFGSDLLSKNFDINDLGIVFQTNYYTGYGNFSYRILQPTKRFNSFSIRTNLYTEFNKETNKPQANSLNVNVNISDKGNNYFGMGINGSPFEVYDYYSPRTDGRFVIQPEKIGGWFFVSTNFNKKFAFDFNPYFTLTSQKSRSSFGISFEPRYRFSDKFSVSYRFNYDQDKNEKGYTTDIGNDIVYARRDNIQFNNSISSKYSISSQMNINLLIRHYWSYSENFNFYSLNNDGRFSNYNLPVSNQNQDFSTWNFDLSYVWWFAPGSQVSVLYRNNATNFSNDINKNGSLNLENLLNNKILSNTFSISLKYFIDYNQAKHWF
jgi:Domain of unknown function (DUF5916)/Carbohydrate family 9 binding domain-like